MVQAIYREGVANIYKRGLRVDEGGKGFVSVREKKNCDEKSLRGVTFKNDLNLKKSRFSKSLQKFNIKISNIFHKLKLFTPSQLKKWLSL